MFIVLYFSMISRSSKQHGFVMDSKIFKEKSFDRQTEMNVDLVFVTQSRHKQVLNQRIKQLLTQKS